MSVEYAPKGLVGVLTPQANTTVEPEYAILTPPGYAFINARMLSPHKTIEERLLDYFANLDTSSRQFANAPIGALAFACTGTSYLVGKDAEDRTLGGSFPDSQGPSGQRGDRRSDGPQRAQRKTHRSGVALYRRARHGVYALLGVAGL